MRAIEPAEVRDTDTILDVRHHVGSEQIRGALRYAPKALLDAPELALPLNTEGRIVLNADSEGTPAEGATFFVNPQKSRSPKKCLLP